MKKKVLTILLCVIITISLLPLTARADMGPKPSVNLQFEGLVGETYYVTLLSQTKSTGPYSAGSESVPPEYMLGDERALGQSAWTAFQAYRDTDGFYFLQYFARSNNAQDFMWGYYPPSTFKVLVYFPHTDTFLVSGIYTRYAFDSYYAVKIQNDSEPATLSLQKNYDYSWEMISLAARIAGTLAIELVIAFFFGLNRKKTFGFIILTNILTQTVLNVLLNISNYSYGSMAFVFHYVWMELLVFGIEAAVYSVSFKKKGGIQKWVAPVYALTANIASFAVGLLIAKLVPGIF